MAQSFHVNRSFVIIAVQPKRNQILREQLRRLLLTPQMWEHMRSAKLGVKSPTPSLKSYCSNCEDHIGARKSVYTETIRFETPNIHLGSKRRIPFLISERVDLVFSFSLVADVVAIFPENELTLATLLRLVTCRCYYITALMGTWF